MCSLASVSYEMRKQEMSTLVAPKDFSPVADAEAIKKACQGLTSHPLPLLLLGIFCVVRPTVLSFAITFASAWFDYVTEADMSHFGGYVCLSSFMGSLFSFPFLCRMGNRREGHNLSLRT